MPTETQIDIMEHAYNHDLANAEWQALVVLMDPNEHEWHWPARLLHGSHKYQESGRDYIARHRDMFATEQRIQDCLTFDNDRMGIYVWVSGRDCDMSSYGYVSFWEGIDTYEKYENECYSWHCGSDGCEYYSIMTPADAHEAESYSRDLALEAYEDGHAHIVSDVRFETY